MRLYITVGAGLIASGLLAWASFYIYTGKGWLVLERKETVADFYFNRGLYYFNGKAYNLSVAEHAFEQALAHAGGPYPYAHYELGRIYFIHGNFSSALAEMDMELGAYPDHAKAHYMKGLIYGYRKQYIQAEHEFIAFNAAVPRQWAGYNDLAWVYFSEGAYADSARAAQQGLAVVPGNPWLQNSYAVAELNLGKYKEAELYFTKSYDAFMAMSEEEWGRSYPGNDPAQYASGLEQIRTAVAHNLTLVHSKLGEQ